MGTKQNEEVEVEILEESTVTVLESPKADTEAEDNGNYVLDLGKEYEYEGKKFSRIEFDFLSLSGVEMLQIEEELAKQSKFTIGVEVSKVNQYLIAVKAANKVKDKNGFIVTSDLLASLPIRAFNDICKATRDVFLNPL